MTKKYYCFFSFLVISVVFTVIGCKDKMGGTYPMTIKVTMDGKIIDGAIVSLVQLTGDGHTAVGISNASGIATIKSTEGWNGVFPGEYTVTIKKTEITTSSTPPPGTEVDRTYGGEDNAYTVSRELLPAQYGNSRTSGLSVTQEKKKGAFEFDITENP